MSSEYMRQILESIEQAQSLNEGYDDRVQAVASWFKQNYPDGISKKQFTQVIDSKSDTLASELGAVELRTNKASAIGSKGRVGDSRKDFIKDVAAKINFKKDMSAADSKRDRVNQVLERLSYIIDEEIGNAFPDGDPFDNIAPKARKMGIPMDNILEWLDRAVKKHLGGKDYYSYLKMMWDQHGETLSTMPGYDPRPNPW